MSNGHSANLRVRSTSSDWLKVDFWIKGPVAADSLHSGTIFDQSDARRHPVSWILSLFSLQKQYKKKQRPYDYGESLLSTYWDKI